MAKYLLIESRDPFESVDTNFWAEMAEGLRERGNDVTLYLIQNGVQAARKGAKHNERLTYLCKQGVHVVADEFSLRERALQEMVGGVNAVSMGQFVTLLMEPGIKAIWH